MPLANRYLTPEQLKQPEIRIPLTVTLCPKCGCVQLLETADPKLLFEEYLYTSSTSGSLAKHFKEYAHDTIHVVRPKPGAFIVGIGGNDGPLEKAYQSYGFRVLNVEPSENISALSKAKSVPTLRAWFNEDTAKRIVSSYGQADIITCNNCFAHMPDIHEVVRGIKALLKPKGCFICESAYWWDTVRNRHFDHIYHEHYFYWTLKALGYLFATHGMIIDAVDLNKSQGGSIRVFAKNSTKSSMAASILKLGEEEADLFKISTYQKWREENKLWMQAIREKLDGITSVSCYGVAAKFTMISEQLGFTADKIEYAVDDSPIKVGRFTPGSHIPIVSREHFIKHPTNHCIITAGNYSDLIRASNPQYEGTWIKLYDYV